MIQETLFSPPAEAAVKVAHHGAKIPPTGVRPAAQAEPLGSCCKCGKPAYLQSPGSMIYCQDHGYCGRMSDNGVKVCLISVEKFVRHPRLEIWVCPCILRFEEEVQRKEADSTKSLDKF